MYFSIVVSILILGIISFIIYRKFYYWEIYIGYVDPRIATLDSYKTGEISKSRYFKHSSGIIDLKKHPELKRFHVIGENKDILIEQWDRNSTITITEGESKVVVFEIVIDSEGTIFFVSCLRKVISVIEEDTDDPYEGYKKTYLGLVDIDNKAEMVSGDKLIGIVKYESI